MNKLSWVPVRLVLIFAILGVFLSYQGIKTISIMSKPAVDIFELESWDSLEENMHIDCDIPIIWDGYISHTTENKVYGATVSKEETSRSYLVPHILYDGSYINVEGFISYATSDYGLMDKMIKESDDWWNDETGTVSLETSFHVEGYLAKLSNKEADLMYEYLEESGIKRNEISNYMYKFKIMHGDGVLLKTGYIELIASIMIYIVIALLLFFLKRRYDKKNAAIQAES